VFGFHLFSNHLISLISLSKVGADVQINVIQIDVFYLFVNFPVSSAISDSQKEADYLSNIPPNHNDQDNHIICLHDFPIVLLLSNLSIANQEDQCSCEDAEKSKIEHVDPILT
jgi:hypothetical protein